MTATAPDPVLSELLALRGRLAAATTRLARRTAATELARGQLDSVRAAVGQLATDLDDAVAVLAPDDADAPPPAAWDDSPEPISASHLRAVAAHTLTALGFPGWVPADRVTELVLTRAAACVTWATTDGRSRSLTLTVGPPL